jgi:hypothetical protein
MTDLKLGILLWNQATSWSDYQAAATLVDRLGYDHLWAWDHLYAIFGDPYQPIFEGWSTLAAMAPQTERTRLGLLVGANTFRNRGHRGSPRRSTTGDGRAIWASAGRGWNGMGLASSSGQASASAWTGSTSRSGRCARSSTGNVTSEPGGHYAFDDLVHAPLPVRSGSRS